MADDKILDDVHESVEFFSNLSCRWEDEHEYEDSSEYSSAFTKNFPKLIVDKIHDSSLYLGLRRTSFGCARTLLSIQVNRKSYSSYRAREKTMSFGHYPWNKTSEIRESFSKKRQQILKRLERLNKEEDEVVDQHKRVVECISLGTSGWDQSDIDRITIIDDDPGRLVLGGDVAEIDRFRFILQNDLGQLTDAFNRLDPGLQEDVIEFLIESGAIII